MKPIYIILGLAFLLMVHPAIRFDQPIVQTDGITYYIPAKIFGETLSFDQSNPKYNYDGTHVRSLNDYPPLTYILLGIPLRFFGHDMVWLNGLFGAFLFVLHLWFLYLLLREITNSERWSLFGTILGALGLRFYFIFYAGMFPTAIGVCLTTPALYFAYRYMDSSKIKDLVFAGLFTLLVGLAYVQQMMLFVIMLICLAVGKYLEMKFPFVKVKLQATKDQPSFVFIPFVIGLLVLTIVMVRYGLMVQTTSSWTKDFLHALIFTHESGYPLVWQIPFLLDGLVVFLLAICAVAYLLWQRSFRLPLLAGGVGSVVAFGVIYIPDIWVRFYFFRYFVELSVLLVILATVMLKALSDNPSLKKEAYVLAIIALVMNVCALLAFFSFVAPAISEQEEQAALYVRDLQGHVTFVNNIPEYTTFRSFNWVVALAQHEDYTLTHALQSVQDTSYVFVGEDARLAESERALLHGWQKKEFGATAVYSR